MSKHLNYKAFIFDLNGTMIDDMPYHVRAWHQVVNELGANLTLEAVQAECYGKNQDLLQRIFPGRFSEEEMVRIGMEKEHMYQKAFRPEMKLIPGLRTFLQRAHEQEKKIAIGSAAIMFNIDFILDGLNIRPYIDVIVSADHVKQSKPHPETFLKCAQLLDVPAERALVFEDAPKGVASAFEAGMHCMVITTMHEKSEFSSFPNVIGFVPDYTGPYLEQLL